MCFLTGYKIGRKSKKIIMIKEYLILLLIAVLYIFVCVGFSLIMMKITQTLIDKQYKKRLIIKEEELTESIDIVLSQLPKQEISDEEIEKSAKEWYDKEGRVHYNAEIRAWVSACKWYREQLKQRQ
jgi:hypothetical protein